MPVAIIQRENGGGTEIIVAGYATLRDLAEVAKNAGLSQNEVQALCHQLMIEIIDVEMGKGKETVTSLSSLLRYNPGLLEKALESIVVRVGILRIHQMSLLMPIS